MAYLVFQLRYMLCRVLISIIIRFFIKKKCTKIEKLGKNWCSKIRVEGWGGVCESLARNITSFFIIQFFIRKKKVYKNWEIGKKLVFKNPGRGLWILSLEYPKFFIIQFFMRKKKVYKNREIGKKLVFKNPGRGMGRGLWILS